MDLTSALKNEVLRPLAITVVPGASAVAPYVVLVHHYNPDFTHFGDRYPVLYVALVLFGVLAAGFVLEDIGARIEANIWDPLIERDTGSQMEDWHSLMLYSQVPEPVGHRYMRTMTLRFKFELSFGLSLIAMWFGLLWIESTKILWEPRSSHFSRVSS
jgi:hypothetical protein